MASSASSSNVAPSALEPANPIVDYISNILQIRGTISVEKLMNYIQMSDYTREIGSDIENLSRFLAHHSSRFQVSENSYTVARFELSAPSKKVHTKMVSLIDRSCRVLESNYYNRTLQSNFSTLSSRFQKSTVYVRSDSDSQTSTAATASDNGLPGKDCKKLESKLDSLILADKSSEEEGIRTLTEILLTKGPLLFKDLVGFLGPMSKVARDAVGRAKPDLLNFLRENKNFVVISTSCDDCIISLKSHVPGTVTTDTNTIKPKDTGIVATQKSVAAENSLKSGDIFKSLTVKSQLLNGVAEKAKNLKTIPDKGKSLNTEAENLKAVTGDKSKASGTSIRKSDFVSKAVAGLAMEKIALAVKSDSAATRVLNVAPRQQDRKAGVKILVDVLKEKGPLPVKQLVGYLSNAPKPVREAIGRNYDLMLEYLRQDKTFIVTGTNHVVQLNTKFQGGCSALAGSKDNLNHATGVNSASKQCAKSSEVPVTEAISFKTISISPQQHTGGVKPVIDGFSPNDAIPIVIMDNSYKEVSGTIAVKKESVTQPTVNAPLASVASDMLLARQLGVSILIKVLLAKGPMPVRNLVGYLASADHTVREAVGRNHDEMLKYLHQDNHFLVEGPNNLVRFNVSCQDSNLTTLGGNASVLNKTTMVPESKVVLISHNEFKLIESVQLSYKSTDEGTVVKSGQCRFVDCCSSTLVSKLEASKKDAEKNISRQRQLATVSKLNKDGKFGFAVLDNEEGVYLNVLNARLGTGETVLKLTDVCSVGDLICVDVTRAENNYICEWIATDIYILTGSVRSSSMIERNDENGKQATIRAPLPIPNHSGSLEQQGVEFLRSILLVTGPLPVKRLVGRLDRTSKEVREFLGSSTEKLLKYLQTSKYFYVEGGENIVSLRSYAVKHVMQVPHVVRTASKVITSPVSTSNNCKVVGQPKLSALQQGIDILIKALSNHGPLRSSSLMGHLSTTTSTVRDALGKSMAERLDKLLKTGYCVYNQKTNVVSLKNHRWDTVATNIVQSNQSLVSTVGLHKHDSLVAEDISINDEMQGDSQSFKAASSHDKTDIDFTENVASNLLLFESSTQVPSDADLSLGERGILTTVENTSPSVSKISHPELTLASPKDSQNISEPQPCGSKAGRSLHYSTAEQPVFLHKRKRSIPLSGDQLELSIQDQGDHTAPPSVVQNLHCLANTEQCDALEDNLSKFSKKWNSLSSKSLQKKTFNRYMELVRSFSSNVEETNSPDIRYRTIVNYISIGGPKTISDLYEFIVNIGSELTTFIRSKEELAAAITEQDQFLFCSATNTVHIHESVVLSAIDFIVKVLSMLGPSTLSTLRLYKRLAPQEVIQLLSKTGDNFFTTGVVSHFCQQYPECFQFDDSLDLISLTPLDSLQQETIFVKDSSLPHDTTPQQVDEYNLHQTRLSTDCWPINPVISNNISDDAASLADSCSLKMFASCSDASLQMSSNEIFTSCSDAFTQMSPNAFPTDHSESQVCLVKCSNSFSGLAASVTADSLLAASSTVFPEMMSSANRSRYHSNSATELKALQYMKMVLKKCGLFTKQLKCILQGTNKKFKPPSDDILELFCEIPGNRTVSEDLIQEFQCRHPDEIVHYEGKLYLSNSGQYVAVLKLEKRMSAKLRKDWNSLPSMSSIKKLYNRYMQLVYNAVRASEEYCDNYPYEALLSFISANGPTTPSALYMHLNSIGSDFLDIYKNPVELSNALANEKHFVVCSTTGIVHTKKQVVISALEFILKVIILRGPMPLVTLRQYRLLAPPEVLQLLSTPGQSNILTKLEFRQFCLQHMDCIRCEKETGVCLAPLSEELLGQYNIQEMNLSHEVSAKCTLRSVCSTNTPQTNVLSENPALSEGSKTLDLCDPGAINCDDDELKALRRVTNLIQEFGPMSLSKVRLIPEFLKYFEEKLGCRPYSVNSVKHSDERMKQFISRHQDTIACIASTMYLINSSEYTQALRNQAHTSNVDQSQKKISLEHSRVANSTQELGNDSMHHFIQALGPMNVTDLFRRVEAYDTEDQLIHAIHNDSRLFICLADKMVHLKEHVESSSLQFIVKLLEPYGSMKLSTLLLHEKSASPEVLEFLSQQCVSQPPGQYKFNKTGIRRFCNKHKDRLIIIKKTVYLVDQVLPECTSGFQNCDKLDEAVTSAAAERADVFSSFVTWNTCSAEQIVSEARLQSVIDSSLANNDTKCNETAAPTPLCVDGAINKLSFTIKSIHTEAIFELLSRKSSISLNELAVSLTEFDVTIVNLDEGQLADALRLDDRFFICHFTRMVHLYKEVEKVAVDFMRRCIFESHSKSLTLKDVKKCWDRASPEIQQFFGNDTSRKNRERVVRSKIKQFCLKFSNIFVLVPLTISLVGFSIPSGVQQSLIATLSSTGGPRNGNNTNLVFSVRNTAIEAHGLAVSQPVLNLLKTGSASGDELLWSEIELVSKSDVAQYMKLAETTNKNITSCFKIELCHIQAIFDLLSKNGAMSVMEIVNYLKESDVANVHLNEQPLVVALKQDGRFFICLKTCMVHLYDVIKMSAVHFLKECILKSNSMSVTLEDIEMSCAVASPEIQQFFGGDLNKNTGKLVPTPAKQKKIKKLCIKFSNIFKITPDALIVSLVYQPEPRVQQEVFASVSSLTDASASDPTTTHWQLSDAVPEPITFSQPTTNGDWFVDQCRRDLYDPLVFPKNQNVPVSPKWSDFEASDRHLKSVESKAVSYVTEIITRDGPQSVASFMESCREFLSITPRNILTRLGFNPTTGLFEKKVLKSFIFTHTERFTYKRGYVSLVNNIEKESHESPASCRKQLGSKPISAYEALKKSAGCSSPHRSFFSDIANPNVSSTTIVDKGCDYQEWDNFGFEVDLCQSSAVDPIDWWELSDDGTEV